MHKIFGEKDLFIKIVNNKFLTSVLINYFRFSKKSYTNPKDDLLETGWILKKNSNKNN